MATRRPDGATWRDFWLQAAQSRKPQSRERAREELSIPRVPPSVEHLHAWIYQLHGKSGVGMEGAAPLTYGTIADWARLTGVEPTGDDVEALMRLDLVMLTEYRAKPDAPTMQQPPEIPNGGVSGSRRR